MQRKQVIFIADSLDNAYKFRQVLSNLDVDVAAGSSLQFKKLLSQKPECDLVVYEARNNAVQEVAAAEQMLVESGVAALLVIVAEDTLADFRLPVQVKSDFVVRGATSEECSARIRQMLWPGNENSSSDFVTVDTMTLNLATYQVQVNGNPLDLTYLEYALLAFLVTHPGRTYSRDALLRRVWGFDYYGGSRTVDVHVRRVRAKLGPELAQHLETVRGVGYLWSN
jgi:DNA-binding response OmpR family regulator